MDPRQPFPLTINSRDCNFHIIYCPTISLSLRSVKLAHTQFPESLNVYRLCTYTVTLSFGPKNALRARHRRINLALMTGCTYSERESAHQSRFEENALVPLKRSSIGVGSVVTPHGKRLGEESTGKTTLVFSENWNWNSIYRPGAELIRHSRRAWISFTRASVDFLELPETPYIFFGY